MRHWPRMPVHSGFFISALSDHSNFPILHNFASICSHVGLFVGLRLSFAKGVNMKSKLIADSIADHLTALTLSLLAEHRIHTCKCGTAPRVRTRGEYVQLFCVTCGRSTKQAQFPLLSDLIREWNGPDNGLPIKINALRCILIRIHFFVIVSRK